MEKFQNYQPLYLKKLLPLKLPQLHGKTFALDIILNIQLNDCLRLKQTFNSNSLNIASIIKSDGQLQQKPLPKHQRKIILQEVIPAMVEQNNVWEPA